MSDLLFPLSPAYLFEFPTCPSDQDRFQQTELSLPDSREIPENKPPETDIFAEIEDLFLPAETRATIRKPVPNQPIRRPPHRPGTPGIVRV